MSADIDSSDLEALAQQGIDDINALLQDIADVILALTNHRFNVNVTKISAAIASIGGGALTTAGLITLPMTFGASGILIGVGIGLSATGGVTIFGSDLVELGITKSNIGAIEAKMKKLSDKVGQIQMEFNKLEKLWNAAVTTGQGVSTVGKLAKTSIFFMAEFGDDAAKGLVANLPMGLGRASAQIGVTMAAVGVAVGAAFDIFTIVQSSIKIHRGNRVECAEKLEKASSNLEDLKNKIQAIIVKSSQE